MTDGPAGHFLEVTPDGQTVWSYTVTDTSGGTGYLVFRAVRYEAGYAGLARRTLLPGGAIRLAPAPAAVRANAFRY